MSNYSEERLQVRQTCLIGYTYTEYERTSRYTTIRVKNKKLSENKKKAYSGTITKGCRKRLSRAIDILCQVSKKRSILNPVTMKRQSHILSFITLTISKHDNITARECYDNCFKYFLQWLRKSANVHTYIWKVEIQKRGQIHYHITTPSFIHYQLIKDKWNNLQSKAGYLADYHAAHPNKMPNSTDIHSVRKVNNLSSYLIKEFCKAIQNPLTKGKVWDCSNNLRGLKYFSTQQNDHNTSCIKEIKDKVPARIIVLDQCTVIKLKKYSLGQMLSLNQLADYDNYCNSLR